MSKPDFTIRELAKTQEDLAAVVKHVYVVVYVEGMLRAEREDISFQQAIECELADRGMLTVADNILDFERFRRNAQEPPPAVQEGAVRA